MTRAQKRKAAKKRRNAERRREASKPESDPKKVGPPDRTYSEAAQSRANEWTTVMSKGKRKTQLREERAGKSGTPPEAPRNPNRSGDVAAKRAGPTKPRIVRDRHALLILPKDETVDSDVTHNLVTSQIDPMKAKVALRGMRKISKGGVLIFADSAADLERLRAEVEKAKLAKDHMVSVSGRRNPEIVVFGVGSDITGDEIVEALKSQNSALESVEISFKLLFQGRKGRNAVIVLDPSSFERIAGRQRLNVGWDMKPFSPKRRPFQCYKCWKNGHMARDCRRDTRCGNYGKQDHIRQDCTSDSVCVNCTEVNTRNPADKALPTCHAADSRECCIYLKRLDLTERKHYGN